MKRLLALTLMLLSFFAMPLASANPVPIYPAPTLENFIFLLLHIGPIVGFFAFLILIVYYANKRFSKK